MTIVIDSVGAVLLHFVWQGILIAAALAAALALVDAGRARLRYALSCLALGLMLAAAVTTAVATAPRSWDGPASLASAPLAPHGPGANAIESNARQGRVADGPRPPGPADAGAVNGASILGSPAVRQAIAAGVPWLVVIWALGVLILTIRLLGGWWATRQLRVAGVSPVPEWCQVRLAEIAARMGVARAVALVASSRIAVPAIVGHVAPVIVLPAAALSGLSPWQLEAILAHELAHVRRHDYLVNLAQTVVETLLFYHPAVWWISGQVRQAREHCCDDLAVAVCRSRRDYVRALLDLEELRGTTPALALGATDGSLLERGRRLLAPGDAAAPAPRLAASVIALTVVGTAAAGASFAAVVPAAAPPAMAIAEPRPSAETVSPNQSGPAEKVLVAPDATGTLDSRWAWAERSAQAARHRRFWIGYAIDPVDTLPRFVYLDRSRQVFSNDASFNGRLMGDSIDQLQFAGRPLDVSGSGRSGVKLLFEFQEGRAPALTGIHASSMTVPIETNGGPVYWLGIAATAESFARVDRFYRAVRSADLRSDLISIAGMHDGSPAVVAWLDQRVASQDDDELRGNAAEWMAYHPITASVTALDRIARRDRSRDVQQEAAEALGDVALPEAAPVLIALARSVTDLDVRREAVEALGARPEPAARDALAAIARGDASVDIQREAVETLGDLDHQRGVDALLDLARTHPNADVRREAIETLGDAMPPATALPLLEKFAAEDADPGVQAEAVEAIASVDGSGSTTLLIALAQSHKSQTVRQEAVEALGDRASRGDRDAIVTFLSSLATGGGGIDVAVEAVETLGEIGGTAAAAALRRIAESGTDPRLRMEAIESLGESDAPAADTAQLLERLVRADQAPEVMDEALETLADLRDGAGTPALIAIARDHPRLDTRREALERLLESDHPAARKILEQALGTRRD